jgi:3-methyl-2-oxobutanoate hydroxymethyltransferase
MRLTIRQIRRMKQRGERIAMLTAYDYTSARLAEAAGVSFLLVGDSLGMVVLGHDSTLPVTLDAMMHHARAVVRGTSKALVVADLPFMTYNVSPEQALQNAGRMMQEAGVQAIKLEGGQYIAPIVERLTACGIPVMGHLGLTPQSIHQLSGFRVQGRDTDTAQRLADDAVALQQAGAFSVVLELVPTELARRISQSLDIPTIGIGAGNGCDGQVQVWHDVLGLYEDFVPKHTKQYATLGNTIRAALSQYVEDVQSGAFPTAEQSFAMDETVLDALYGPPVRDKT